MVVAIPLLSMLPIIAAWPSITNRRTQQYQRSVEPPHRDPLFLSGRPNTGIPPLGFDAKSQFVDVRPGSDHEWRAPGPGDIRGLCPGLNAAANHGFLNRSGITNIPEAIQGLGEAYSMSPDMSGFLSVLSVALAGDLLKETWSIGGEFPSSLPLIRATGIDGTHNQYEGDASITRGDAYLNDGDVGVFQMRSWEHFWELAEEYTLDDAAAQSDYVTRWSILNNPYYFSAPFSGLVAPVAHDFAINFMSNHSAEKPGGTLTRAVLKSFFSVTGDKPGEFLHTPGHERIPLNWYKRSILGAYNLPEAVVDLLVNNQMYPGIIRFGGNTGTTNSFAGVDLRDLTGGLWNLEDLAKGNNGACFLLQASLAGLPDAVDPLLGLVGSVANWATQKLAGLNSRLGCPQLKSFDHALFNQFPGAGYQANGQDHGFLGNLIGRIKRFAVRKGF